MSHEGAGRDTSGAPAIPATAAATPVPGEIIERLNTWWRISGPPPSQASFRHRLAYPLRRMLARVLGPQETFNATVVQYVNATMTAQQQILATAFERADAAVAQVDRHREALAARERRIDAAMTTLRAEHHEMHTALGVLQHVTRELQKGAARIAAAAPAAAPSPGDAVAADGATAPATSRSVTVPASPVPEPDGHALSHKYVGFEDQFRGSEAQIRERLGDYVRIFEGASDVLDIGCGRGEFLRLLREAGVSARGIDLNDTMVEVCHQRGLDASVADALSYLRAQPDESLGGLFAAQVVEHLEPAYLTQLLDVAAAKLRPGATIVLETINPACWFAFFESYIRDITHVRPLHPDTLKFLLVASGFQQVDIRYRVPYPEHEKLQPIAAPPGLTDAAETLNANVEKINRLLFTYLDYAAVAVRG